MNFENIEKIRSLKSYSKTLHTLIDVYNEKISTTNCDKYSLSFGGDSRFSVFSVKIFLDCHVGFYGNSNCSTLASVDNNVAVAALNKVLNNNKEMIFREMAKEIECKAVELLEKAENEVKEASEFLASIEE